MFFSPDGTPMPSELQEILQAHTDRMQMSAEAARHDILRFIDELKVEQLITLRRILGRCTDSGGKLYASHMEGYVSGVIQHKHEVCIGCGQKHDDISELVTESNPQVEGETEEDGTEQMSLFDDEDFRADAMRDFGLREPHEGEVQLLPDERPVICEGCGMLYQSLEDRMLRPPGIDGCHGCQVKSAHG